MEQIPFGKCQCGCNNDTWVATTTNKKYGWQKGHPVAYCRGHNPNTRGTKRGIGETELVCSKCGVLQKTDEFQWVSSSHSYSSHCRSCRSIYKSNNRREYNIAKRYNLTLSEYEEMFRMQDGRCSICNKLFQRQPLADRACVDHCHETNKVRGLLCNNCNIAIGLLRDDVTLLRKAISYLEE